MEYARKVQKKRRLMVGAYRASMESLFPLCTRKKQSKFPAKLLFANQYVMRDSINPLKLLRKDTFHNYDESGDKQQYAPVIIGCLPTANQQANMLTSLVHNLIMHLCVLQRNTMFQFGSVKLMTFLSAHNFALAVCAQDENMWFMSAGSKHKSWLLNKLFTIKPVSGYLGFPRHTFSPHFPLPSSLPHEKKFDLIGIRNENLYCIAIEPRSDININNLDLFTDKNMDDGIIMNSMETLVKYAFWIIFTGKMTAKTKVAQKLREWFPKTSINIESVVDSNTRVADLKLEEFDKIFSLIHTEINDDFKHINELRSFYAYFMPADENVKFAD
ncbi:unnamed protein product [Thelazia callipaeda]|uniref:UDENN domain-containing protein n=1 Tax=Thelazia callipaeda TaxID=103827 RepID=A0A158RCZ9_THECL|nr:unnamed protein product [Thelazia callipaeda]